METEKLFETTPPKRYAFIDANNTAATTEKMLGFVVDWKKLVELLKGERWRCEKVFVYSGIEIGDTESAEVFSQLNDGTKCVTRTKTTIVYKNPEKKVMVKCPGETCGNEFVKVFDMGYRKKSNCDVELTIDVLDHIGPDTELMIFTADGDFEMLLQRALDKGAKIYIVSHQKKYKDKAGYTHSRFSSKLRELIAKNPEHVTSVDIARWKELIKKEIKAV